MSADQWWDAIGWQQPRTRPAVCGTNAGYYRHRDTRAGRIPTEPCEACKSAHATAESRRLMAAKTA